MTEAEWLASDDPAAMLRLLSGNEVGPDSPVAWRQSMPGAGINRISDRKLRLWCHACCYHAYGPGDRMRDRYDEWLEKGLRDPQHKDKGYSMARIWAGQEEGYEGQNAARAALLRDLFGNPFRPLYWADDPKKHARMRFTFGGPSDDGAARHPRRIVVRRAWMTPTVRSLAHAAYDHRFDDGELDRVRLTVLADALMDAGCDCDDLLDHLCRPAAYHVRGCWALDLILGKE